MECKFTDDMMNCKDQTDGLSREGCGRVAIMQAANGLPNCYTLECNYASGRRINHISQKRNTKTKKIEPETQITDPKSKLYTEHFAKSGSKNPPPYTIEVFKDVGHAFCVSILDFHKCNPVTRISTSWFKNLEGVKEDLI